MIKQCTACGRHLLPHKHGKRQHCSAKCAWIVMRAREHNRRGRIAAAMRTERQERLLWDTGGHRKPGGVVGGNHT